ncbi:MULTISPECIES: hypothetical protein [Protofrankia]|uniref:DUF5666 domain-containing protein n=1 Tax=Candidatus Protofrankia datiscae TaxID=2716812 RepID=F8B3M3_9ACTN|nr:MULTISPECIES: hypothetical protein [Protofrankia]AEH07861.1 hypothetical protein FsymDg_0289 [Candidatus Protofrankia datiscae]
MRPRLGTMLTTIATVGTLSIAGITAVALASPDSTTSLISPAGAATSLSPSDDSSKDTATLDSDRPRHRHHHGHGGPGWWGYDDDVDDWAASRPLHGDATVRTDDGYQVVTYQRGELTNVSQTSATIKSKDGYEATYAVTGDTDLWIDGDDAGIGDFKTGTTVVVAAAVDGDTRTVEHLVELSD